MPKTPSILGYLFIFSQLLTSFPSYASILNAPTPQKTRFEENQGSAIRQELPLEYGAANFDVATTTPEDIKARFNGLLKNYIEGDFQVNQRSPDGSPFALFEILVPGSNDPKYIIKILDPLFLEHYCNFCKSINLQGLEAKIIAWHGNAFVAEYLKNDSKYMDFDRLKLAAKFLSELHSRKTDEDYEDKVNPTLWKSKYAIDHDVALNKLRTMKESQFFDKLFKKMAYNGIRAETIDQVKRAIDYLESLGSLHEFFSTAVLGGKVSFCHNDLHLGNIFYTNPQAMQAIDWDDAGLNYCVFDLAFCAICLAPDCLDIRLKEFLDSYLEKESTKTQRQDLIKAMYFAAGYVAVFDLIEKYIDACANEIHPKVQEGIGILQGIVNHIEQS